MRLLLLLLLNCSDAAADDDDVKWNIHTHIHTYARWSAHASIGPLKTNEIAAGVVVSQRHMRGLSSIPVCFSELNVTTHIVYMRVCLRRCVRPYGRVSTCAVRLARGRRRTALDYKPKLEAIIN